MKDLILLVADKSMQFTLQGGLGRAESLDIRPISFDFRQHPGRDGGARSSGAQILALERNRFAHALLVLDHEGSGANESPPELDADDSRAGGCPSDLEDDEFEFQVRRSAHRAPCGFGIRRQGGRTEADRRSACFHARFALEAVVHWLYRHDPSLRMTGTQ